MADKSDRIAGAHARHVSLLQLLEIHRIEVGDGRATFEMVVDEKHLRSLGILHGGVTATLLDTVMGFAAATKAAEGFHVVTIQLNVNFIRPAWESQRLLATGEIRHAGRQTAVAHGEVRMDEETLVAAGTATFLYLPTETPGEGIAD